MKESAEKSKIEKNPVGKFKIRYIFYLIIAVALMLAVFSHSPEDKSLWEQGEIVSNYIGNTGAFVAAELFANIGIATYLLVILLLLYAGRNFIFDPPPERKFYIWGVLMVIIGSSVLLAINPAPFAGVCADLGLGRKDLPEQVYPGGVIGQLLSAPGVENPPVNPGFLRKYIGYVGTIIFSWALMTAGFVIIYLSDWHSILKRKFLEIPEKTVDPEVRKPNSALKEALAALKEKQASLFSHPVKENIATEPEVTPAADELPLIPEAPEIKPEPAVAVANIAPAIPKTPTTPSILNSADPDTTLTVKGESAKASHHEYTLPLITMLSKGAEAGGESIETINASKQALQNTLDSFKINGTVTNHISGPRVTRYEIVMEPGVKVEKVTGIANNIAMDLKAKSIRILAPIPGKNAVGVEAPNVKSEAVFMRQIMENELWQKNTSEIPIVLGKDVSGRSVILDLAKAPHLLIAGSTGSGKSVCMNTLIMSLLFKFSPDELRLIMVDPKVVELKDYEKLPHLITPVINDSKKVPIALRWAVNEMERRYHVLAKVGVKNLRGFNSRKIEHPEFDDAGNEIPQTMPVLVIIIDELADLMMTDAKPDVEYSIARITAKGRAAGIHIVVATQRPSTNVITGVIKANLPTRIAFRVGQLVDSRVILDQKGAETLLGKGDMLYLPPGSADLERVQGAMVEDNDIKNIVKFISDQRPEQNFVDDVVAEEVEAEEESPGKGYDRPSELDNEMESILSDEYAPIVAKYTQPGDSELLKKALEITIRDRQASTSYFQRRLKIGYNRAAELVDELEARGIIGPPGPGGNKREIFIYDEINSNL